MSPDDYKRGARTSGVPSIRMGEPAAAPITLPTRASTRRVAQAVTRSFKAGEHDRLVAGWSGMPLTADIIIQKHQRVLVARSREQSNNNDHAKAFLRMCRQNIVGPAGVLLQAQATKDDGKLDKEVNTAIETAFGQWGHRDNCDVTGAESWRSLQNSCVQSAAKDGEFMLRKVYGKDAGPWGFALQILDPVRCPVDYDVQRLNGGTNFIRHGIEFTRFGRPVAYHITTTDQSEIEYQYGGRNYMRIPAGEIIHGYRKEMTSQKRGLPWMATALYTMRHLAGFEEAVIVNARIGASKAAFIKYEPGTGPEYDEDEPPEMDVEPGTINELPGGASIEEWNPQFPAGESGPFVKHLLRKIAAGLGVPYNELAADLEGVNFSSIRQGTLDSREGWKELQEWLVESLIQPVFEAWLSYSLLAGRIKLKGRPLPASQLERYSVVSWQPRRWDWIDPRADSDAAVTAKNNFLKSPSQIMREQGRDPGTVWAETAADMRTMVDEMVAQGFTEEQAMDLLKVGFGIQPKPPAAAAKPQPKATDE